MTDHDPDPSPEPKSQDGISERVSVSTGRPSHASNDTRGSSSTTLRHSTSIGDNIEAVDMAYPRSANETRQSSLYHTAAFLSPETDQTASEPRRRPSAQRPQRPKSTGGFLLSGALHDGANETPRATGQLRRNNISIGQRGKTSARNHEASPNSRFLNSDIIPTRDGSPNGAEPLGHGTVKRRSASSRKPIQRPDSSPAEQATTPSDLDVDSAQIVNMALNLSESRRLASKRNVSQPLPPRLAPLPDSTVGGSLKAQLQQQRRTSRNISPSKALRETRLGSTSQRVASPLQSGFDLSEGAYRYHFSQSTLARAQKAREYLELLAQNRRVLELIPPLKPNSMRSAAGSPPVTPVNGTGHSLYFGNFGKGQGQESLNRAYNPLQYIRNRKVRLRERKAIDGTEMGFADVPRVTEWVDDIAKWISTGQTQTPGTSLLPPFAAADEVSKQESPPSTIRNAATASKHKRPRVDWTIDPADMLADIYWLEQGDNKRLVEDRHWRRVFPQNAELYRTITTESNPVESAEQSPGPIAKALEKVEKALIPERQSLEQSPPVEAEAKEVPTTARERARQKLHDLKGHHRKRSSMHGDFLKFRRGSISDSSGSDSERKRMRKRQNTITARDEDVLNKQMMEMIARDNRERPMSPQVGEVTNRERHQGLMTPPRLAPGKQAGVPSRVHSRRESRADLSESDGVSIRDNAPRSGLLESPIKTGRVSLEVPRAGRRFSNDYDSSRPTSPELRASHRELGFVPVIGGDLSPSSSRRSSPTRNPFSKVKSLFRDHSRERSHSVDRTLEDVEDATGAGESKLGKLFNPPTPSGTGVADRKGSPSPSRKMVNRNTGLSHRSHRSVGSLKLREESSTGFRHFIRGGQRIDTVLRSGVSKVSDMIWRRDSTDLPDEDDTPASSDDEHHFEDEKRGRSRDSVSGSRGTSQQNRPTGDELSKTRRSHDSLPSFISLSATRDKAHHGNEASHLHVSPISRTPSRRSSRFDRLKPPTIDVHNASPNSTPPPPRFRGSADVSDTDSRKSSYTADAGARLNAVLALPSALTSRRRSLAPERGHWSFSSQHRDASSTADTMLTRREIARLRAMILSQGTMAREVARNAGERRTQAKDLPVEPLNSFYPTTARALTAAIQASASTWQTSASHLTQTLMPPLHDRDGTLRSTLSESLDGAAAAAAREADEIGRDLLPTQRLKARRVADSVEKLLRRRRRRFRWARRAGWLGVEWALVGFMWYVWFVVMIARVILGIGKGMVGVVRWLLWL